MKKINKAKLCLNLETTSENMCLDLGPTLGNLYFEFEETPQLISTFDHIWQCPLTKMLSNSLGRSEERNEEEKTEKVKKPRKVKKKEPETPAPEPEKKETKTPAKRKKKLVVQADKSA